MEDTQARPLRVLLVEDSKVYAAQLKAEIERNEPGGFAMSSANSLAEGQAALKGGHFDAMLLDLNLPESRGLATVKWAQVVCPHLPVVVLTAQDDSAEGVEAVRMGVQNFMVKGREDAWTIAQAIRYAIEKKKLEGALHQSAAHLQTQNQELERIIGVVSHDLRAPLMNVRGFNHALKQDCQDLRALLQPLDMPADLRAQVDGILNESMIESTDFIETSAAAMDNLAQLLVKVARSGSVSPEPVALDMNELIKGVVGSIQIKFDSAGAKVAIGELPPCLADRMHVTQVFTNLLDNAAKYLDASRPGQIRVTGEVQEDIAVYQVADNGLGIAPEHQEKVFDMFFQIGGKSAAGGMGIGLAVVKRMVERNNGRVWFTSEKGKGSDFFVALPVPPE